MAWRYITLPDCTRLWRWYAAAGLTERAARIVGPCSLIAVVALHIAVAATLPAPHPGAGVSEHPITAPATRLSALPGAAGESPAPLLHPQFVAIGAPRDMTPVPVAVQVPEPAAAGLLLAAVLLVAALRRWCPCARAMPA